MGGKLCPGTFLIILMLLTPLEMWKKGDWENLDSYASVVYTFRSCSHRLGFANELTVVLILSLSQMRREDDIPMMELVAERAEQLKMIVTEVLGTCLDWSL